LSIFCSDDMKRNFFLIIAAVIVFAAGSWGLSTFLTGGLLRQYGLHKDAEILILGHSHVMLALNAETMQEKLGMSVSKYTREGVNVPERKLMAEHYLRLHPKAPLKYVIYGVDPYLFTMEGLSANSYLNFLPFMDDPAIDRYVKANASSVEYWKNKMLPLCRFSDGAINAGISGWMRHSGESLKTGKLDIEKTRMEIANGKIRLIKINSEAVQCFQETVALFTARGCKVILLNTPIIDLYNQEEAEMHQKVEAIYRKMAAESNLIEYIDLCPKYETRYELFRDPIHLNRDGQREITDSVVSHLKNEDYR